jgi:Domain of unknown function (DUF4157)
MLATAKAAGPRHGDTSVAPQRRTDSLVDDLDTAVGLPRYLGIQTTLANGSREGPPVQQKCAACEAEDEASVQTQDAGLPPVQAKCAACEEAEEKKVQLCDCSEHEEPTRVQTEDAGLPPVQAKCAACVEAEEKEEDKDQVTQRQVQLWDCSEYEEPTCVQTQEAAGPPVQEKCAACEKEDEEEALQHKAAPGVRTPRMIHQAARTGLVGASNPLPHGDRIQAAFGRHDVSHVRANVGGSAHAAARRMGALAFTSGDRIGFREAPDLHLAAHEAAHTVQQHAGLSLPGNVGHVGDPWERHADRVADAVVGGHSAEPLLDQVTGPGASAQPEQDGSDNVQRQITSGSSRLFEPPPMPPDVPAMAPEEEAAPEAPAGEPEGEATSEAADEEPAIEAAEGGASEAPPEGVTEGGAAEGGGEDAAPAAEEEAGGGLSAPCYDVESEPPPDDTEEPTSDPPPGEASAEASVTFDAWEDESDVCSAEATVAEGGERTAASLTDAGGGEGAAAPAEVTASATTVAAEAGGGGAGGGPPGASAADGGGGGGGGAAEAESAAAADASMEAPIGSAESERMTAIADYEASMGGLGAVEARSQGLGQEITFEPAAGGPQDAAAREAAVEQVRAFMSGALAQIAGGIAFARDQVPGRLGGLAETMKANVQGTMEVEKGAISGRIAQARRLAITGANEARGHVEGEYAASMALVEAETAAAIGALDAEHIVSLESVDQMETAGLDDVNARFAAGRTQHEDKGPEYSARATARAQEHVAAYEHCKRGYRDDGFWDGCLTVRRAKAQQDAACKTATAYHDGFLRTANKKGYDLKPLRTQYRCAVIAGARQVNETIDNTHSQLISGLETGRTQAIAGLGVVRRQNLAAIDAALRATLTALSAQEYAQRQSVNDTGYMKQLAIEQLAHASVANLARGISAAMDSLAEALTSLRNRMSSGPAPDAKVLAGTLAGIQLSLGGGMGTLLGRMEAGAAGAEGRLAETGAAALEALTGITASNDDMTGQAESGFATQMSGVMSGASHAFGHLTNGHVQKAQQSASEGTASMQAAVAGFEGALATIGERVDAAIATSLGELDRELSGTLRKLDGKIATAAWKAAEKEQPAWKSVVAIVLVILVIIAAAVISIVTLGAGASLFAIILVGALVGAVSAGLIQIINNWASGEEWHAGLAQAMIMGALGGAIGGGLGFAGGALVQGAAAAGARVVTQLAIQVGADLVSEGITQTIGYVAFGQDFNWQGFVMAGAMSGVSFRAHPSVPHGAAPHAAAPHAPAPHAPAPRTSAGAAGGRRAAVTQIAGGAAVGFGVEVATSAVTGQDIDLTRAASAAASGAVGARMSRLGGADVAPPRTGEPAPPRSRAGRALDRARAFDPGGVGGRAQTALEGLGGRAFGPRPAADVPGTRPPTEGPGTPRVEEPETARVRPPEEPETARPRAPEEAEPARPRAADEAEATRRLTADEAEPSRTLPSEEPAARRPQPAEESEPARPRSTAEEGDVTGPRSREETIPERGTVRAEADVDVGGNRHTLKVVETDNGPILTICTDCRRVRGYIQEALATPDLPAAIRTRLEELQARVVTTEANLRARPALDDVTTLRNMVRLMAEVDFMVPRELAPGAVRRPRESFAELTDNPDVASRAAELYGEIYAGLWESRRPMFRGREQGAQLQAALILDARARALQQARVEVEAGLAPRPAEPLALEPGAPARTVVDPDTDFPMGFRDRAGFDAFAGDLNAQVRAIDPDAELVLQGSSVSGRRYERSVDFDVTGEPFDVGRISDYDVAIVSDVIHQRSGASELNIPLGGRALTLDEIDALGLRPLHDAAQQAAIRDTGIAHEVKFMVYPHGGVPNRGPALPVR